MLSRKKNLKILAIETSCDETAASVIEKSGPNVRILSNVVASQIEIHKKFGGVFPEHASRAHAEKIIPVVEEALLKAEGSQASEMPVSSALRFVRGQETRPKRKTMSRLARVAESELTTRGLNDIDLIAVTTGPGLIGSLLIGVNFAKTYAFAKNKPIIPINHLLGHIYSNWAVSHSERSEESPTNVGTGIRQRSFANAQDDKLPQFPSLILIVSGGHTGLVLMKSHDKIVPLGETLDDAAGEAFDKVAKLLGLGYPGGPEIAKAAAKFSKGHSEQSEESPAHAGSDIRQRSLAKARDDIFTLPRPMLDSGDHNFSFSGLKTAVLYKTKELDLTCQMPNQGRSLRLALAAEFQQAVIDILVGKTIQAAYEYQPKSICLCGGVSANKELGKQMKKAVSGLPWHPTFHIPHFELTTDNAAMIGIAAAYHIDDATTFDKISANSNLKL